MPLERVFSTPTQVYTSRWLAIQRYAETHPRITGDKIGQRVTAVVLEEFQGQVKDVLYKDKDFMSEPLPVQEFHTDQEVIKKFWGKQGLSELKRDIGDIKPAESSRTKKEIPAATETFSFKPATRSEASSMSADIHAPVSRNVPSPAKSYQPSTSPSKRARDLYRSDF